MPIFLLLAVHQPKWVSKKIDKLRRAFLWAGSDAVCGGKCLVRWTQVCSPISIGGLGIHDLQAQGRALKVRWLWQRATGPDKPWQGLQLPVDKHVKALFIACASIKIGNGIRISFWLDHCSAPRLQLFHFLTFSSTARTEKYHWLKVSPIENGSPFSSATQASMCCANILNSGTDPG